VEKEEVGRASRGDDVRSPNIVADLIPLPARYLVGWAHRDRYRATGLHAVRYELALFTLSSFFIYIYISIQRPRPLAVVGWRGGKCDMFTFAA